MIILGIDPGSRKAGYAFIEVQGRKIRYLKSGVLRFDKVDEFLERLDLIYKSCEDLVDELHPDEIALESLIFVKSPTALMKLAQARGAMIAALSKTHKGKIVEYSPNLIKSSVTGHGHASKEGVEKGLSIIFGQKTYKTNDESDALAIAVCHALNKGHKVSGKGKGLAGAIKHRISL